MTRVTRKSRSPLKSQPLRLPGQSAEAMRRRLVEDRFEAPAFVAILLTSLAGFAWLQVLLGTSFDPWLLTAAAIAAIAFAAWRFWMIRPLSRAYRQAVAGERAVGQYLDALRERGYRVFHDVVGEGFNLDHVLIGPAGVFTVETKTWSKPAHGDARIAFDGECVKVADRAPDRRPVIQALAQAGWLRELLAESTGKTFPVWPVIVFPGWYVESADGARARLGVLSPKALPAFLGHEPGRLGDEDVRLASYHLSRFVRGIETEPE